MAEDGFLAATDRFSFWLQVLAAALLLIVVVILACGYRINKKRMQEYAKNNPRWVITEDSEVDFFSQYFDFRINTYFI